LPFPGARKLYNEEAKNMFHVSSLQEVGEYITDINSGKKTKVIVVEDFSHLLGQRVLEDSNIVGYTKWNKLAVDAFEAVIGIENELRDDLYVILIAHTTTVQKAEGEIVTHMLTPGKLLDNLIKIPSYFTYVFHTEVIEEKGKILYKFLTNRDGSGKEAKSPEGCFELYEENDYAMLIKKIEAYQNGN
jgi:hypothetical protein